MFAWNNKNYTYADHVVGLNERVIKRTARAAKQAVIAGFHVEDVAGVPRLLAGDRVQQGMIRNPLTRKLIEVGGRVYRNLIREGWVQLGNGGLIQPDQVEVVPLNVEGLDLHRAFRDFIGELALGQEGREIFYLQGGDRLVRVNGFTLNNILGAANEILGEYDEDRRQAFYDLLTNGENPLQGLSLVIPTTPMAQAQLVAAADADGYCVKRCLEAEWPDRDWSMVPDCCGDAELDTIARSQKIHIRVWMPSIEDAPVKEYRDPSTAGGHTKGVINLVYQFNHVVRRPPKMTWATDKAEVIFYDNKEELEQAFKAYSMEEPVRPMLAQEGDGVKFFGFVTQTQQHKLRFLGCDRQPTAWTPTGAARKEFIDAAGRPTQQERLKEHRQDGIVNRGLMYRVPHQGPIHVYDQKRAYASYEKCPYYRGFPDPRGVCEVFRWDPSILDKDVEGLGLVRTTKAYPDTVFESECLWAPLPQIRYALARGEVFKVDLVVVTGRVSDPYQGVWQKLCEGKMCSTPDGEIACRGKLCPSRSCSSKQWFNALVGRQFMHQKSPLAAATSMAEVAALAKAGLFVERCFEVDDGRKVWLCGSVKTDPMDPEFPYLSAYIHAYQKITLHHDLLSRLKDVGMVWSDVVGIWIDGVSLKKRLPKDFLSADRWHPEKTLKGIDWGYPLLPPVARPDTTPAPVATFDPFLIQRRVALLGPPGSGKSTEIRDYWGKGRILMLTASTHLAANSLGGDTTAQKLIQMYKKAPNQALAELHGIDRLVVDEFTLLGKKDLETLLELDVPLLLSGDFEQLCGRDPVDEEWLRANGFQIKRLEEIRRATDLETKQLYRSTRGKSTREIALACEKAGVQRAKGVVFPKAGERAHYVASRNDIVDAINVRYAAAVAAGPVRQWGSKRIVRAKAGPGMLVIGVTTTKLFRNQEIGFLVRVINDRVALVRRQTGEEVQVAFKAMHPGFAITFHRCQGQTFDFPLTVNLDRLFHRSMLYVAVTRVTSLRKLTFVGGPDDLNDIPDDREEGCDLPEEEDEATEASEENVDILEMLGL